MFRQVPDVNIRDAVRYACTVVSVTNGKNNMFCERGMIIEVTINC